MENLSAIEQYLIFGVGAIAITFVVLWLYNRREKRRKHALELAGLMRDWGLSWFAEGYEDYAVGDYSGLAHKIKEVVQAVRTDEAMIAKLWDVTIKVATAVAQSDESKANQLRQVLTTTTTIKKVGQ